MENKRSPLNPHALNLTDVRATPGGAEIVIFNRGTGSHRRILVGVTDEVLLTAQVPGAPEDSLGNRLYCEDMGLVPKPDGTWNEAHCVVLPEHANSLPPVDPDYDATRSPFTGGTAT